MPLVKRFSRGGDSTGVIHDKQLLKIANTQEGSEVESRVEGNTIVPALHRYASDESYRNAKERVIHANRRALSRLAK